MTSATNSATTVAQADDQTKMANMNTTIVGLSLMVAFLILTMLALGLGCCWSIRRKRRLQKNSDKITVNGRKWPGISHAVKQDQQGVEMI